MKSVFPRGNPIQTLGMFSRTKLFNRLNFYHLFFKKNIDKV